MRRTTLLLDRPGWEETRKLVDRMIAQGYTYSEIVDHVAATRKAPGKLHLSTLQRYHQQKYSRQARILEMATTQAEAALKVIEQHGALQSGELVRMNLVQSFLQNQHKLADADPIKVGWLQVQYEHIAQQRAQLEQQKRELDLKLEQIQEKAQKATRAIDAALVEARNLDEETKRKIREEVYGIVAA